MMMLRSKKIVSFCIYAVSKVPIRHSSSTTDPVLNNFLSIKSPENIKSLAQYHAYIIITGHHRNNIFISSKLISLYASLRDPASSKQVFDSFDGFKDTFIWNSIIKAYFSNGMYPLCLDFYVLMRVLTTLLPNQFTVPMVVSACAELADLVYGMIVHGLVFKLGIFEGNSAVGSSFVYMYSKCRSVEGAQNMFDEMSMRDVIAWTALVVGYVQNGESEKALRCLCEMYKRSGDDERPNYRTVESGFQACGEMAAVYAGRCLHGVVVKSGLGSSIVVQSSILSMYSKCGTLREAYMQFCDLQVKDIKSWTSIISIYGKLGCIKQCLDAFKDMLESGIHPDPIIVSCVLSCLANAMSISGGKIFHGVIVRRNYDGHQMVHNALLSMYCKFELISYADNVFNGQCIIDEEFWNIMVYGYGKVGHEMKCINLFTEMLHLGIHPNINSLVSVISLCSQMGKLHLRSLHCYAIKSLMQENVSLSNSLIDMYGNMGELTIARRLFCMADKDIITWNTMISTYTRSGHYAEAFSLFDKMILEGIKPNPATFVIVISACAHIASFEKGEQIRKHIDHEMLVSSVPVTTALVDMYAKCGKLEEARKLFEEMKERDIVSWNVMISGYGIHGDARSSIQIFKQMEKSKVKPNEITFLATLSACNHGGLVQEGNYLFGKMGDYSIKPTLKHYACMVDLLGRSGNLSEAEKLVLSMPIAPDGGLWGALLSACRIFNDFERGIRIAKRAIECDPENDGYYIMISNLYDSIGMWEEAEKMRNIMKEKGVKKAVGWSSV